MNTDKICIFHRQNICSVVFIVVSNIDLCLCKDHVAVIVWNVPDIRNSSLTPKYEFSNILTLRISVVMTETMDFTATLSYYIKRLSFGGLNPFLALKCLFVSWNFLLKPRTHNGLLRTYSNFENLPINEIYEECV